MIITKLKGGLGNQLFQYAVARQLAEKHKTTLKIDVSMFETYHLHTYSMWPLNIHENIASTQEIENFTILKSTPIERLIKKILRIQPKPPTTYIKEKHFNFDPDILNMPDNIFLDGWWQDEKYFPDIKEKLKTEFAVKTPATGKNKETLEKITTCESVSLHIRRTNYVSNPHTNKIHGTCSLDYYNKCVASLAKKLHTPHFFIFSDDPEWARDNLNIPHLTTFVRHNNAEKDYEDLRLMSKCKHHIIANSTFSWWGAWLCDNPDKVIFAPKKWFNDKSINAGDLIPNSWIKV